MNDRNQPDFQADHVKIQLNLLVRQDLQLSDQQMDIKVRLEQLQPYHLIKCWQWIFLQTTHTLKFYVFVFF